jgi:hypothetical protein
MLHGVAAYGVSCAAKGLVLHVFLITRRFLHSVSSKQPNAAEGFNSTDRRD